MVDFTTLSVAATALGPSVSSAVHPYYRAESKSSPGAPQIESALSQTVMRIGILPDAAIYGINHTISTNGAVLRDSLYLSRDAADTIRRSSVGSLRLAGTAVAAGNAAKGGYYHWVAQVLPAILHARRFKVGDFAYVTPQMKRWMRDGFELIADGRRPLVELPKDYTLFADAVVYSTILSESAFVAVPLRGELRDRLKARLNIEPCTPFRRLFVSRRDTLRRPVANTDEVERFFAASGFEIIVGSELSFPDQVRIFHQAAVVAGAHGGGLTNVMFCQAGAAVYELHQADAIVPCMAALCQTAGLRYFYDLFPSEGGRKTAGWTVDLNKVALTLADLVV